jgi:prepilin signal peptidase PulO-like enzyme (type II secretory pathway)
MEFPMGVALFALGLAAGSFLNVVSLRYDPDRFLFARPVVGGRSTCPHCKKTLRWFELIPLISFLIQRGRCLRCGVRLSLQYPIVELLSGVIFVAVPWRVLSLHSYLPTPTLLVGAPTLPGAGVGVTFLLLSGIWILALLTLLLVALIDLRLRIIPDECNALLVLLGIAAAALTPALDGAGGSLLRSYGILMFVSSHVWLNKLLGFLAGGAGMLALAVLTRGRGMGMGDVKLAAALGALYGSPDIAVLLGTAFVLGALAGLLGIAVGKKTMKSALPFGPALTLAAAFVFFAGFEFVQWYLSAFVG